MTLEKSTLESPLTFHSRLQYSDQALSLGYRTLLSLSQVLVIRKLVSARKYLEVALGSSTSYMPAMT